jgi:hypothetical protein
MQFRFLSDHWIANRYYFAGETASTADVGGTLPTGWVPSNNVEPLDTPAVAAFYAQGPQQLGLVRGHWTGLPVAQPTTFWQSTPIPGARRWQLTGLGVGQPAICM